MFWQAQHTHLPKNHSAASFSSTSPGGVSGTAVGSAAVSPAESVESLHRSVSGSHASLNQSAEEQEVQDPATAEVDLAHNFSLAYAQSTVPAVAIHLSVQ